MITRTLIAVAAIAAVCICCSPAPATVRQKAPAAAPLSSPAFNGDPRSADYYLERIERDEWREVSVVRLSQLFDDAGAEADLRRKGDVSSADDPALKALGERCVGPLAKAYAEHREALSPAARTAALRTLQALRDPRGEPAVRKAVTALLDYVQRAPQLPPEEYAPTPAEELELGQELELALSVYSELDFPSLAKPLLDAYVALRKRRNPRFCVVAHSMAKRPQRLWADEMLDVVRQIGQTENDYYDQCWNETAIRVLGRLADERAVLPLLRLADSGFRKLVDPALIGVVPDKLARDILANEPAALKLLDLKPGDEAVILGARLLGLIGNPEARPALEQALARHRPLKVRAAIIRALSDLPATPGSHAVIRQALSELSRRAKPSAFLEDDDFPPRVMDPELVGVILPWQRTLKTKSARRQLLVSAALLMGPEQLAEVERAAKSETDDDAREVVTYARSLVERCQKNVDCYFDAFKQAATAKRSSEVQITFVKAAYMMAAFGDTEFAIRMLSEKSEMPLLREFAFLVDVMTPYRSPALEALLEKSDRASDERVQRVLARLRRRPPRP